jgi:VWFA-related protein
MRPLCAAVLVSVACWLASLAAQPEETGDLVLLDVVVTDERGGAVPGLTAADFTVKEDGRAVDIKTFAAVNGQDDDNPRSLVLLMDDLAVPRSGTPVMQLIARNIVDRVPARDEVAVVRLSQPSDEAFGDRILAAERIAAFRGSMEPYVDPLAAQDMLRRFAAVSEQITSLETARKTVICIGAPIICNTIEPSRNSKAHWALWVAALGAASRANVATYAIIPGRVRFRSGGLPEYTGGRLFAGASTFDTLLNQILQDARHYYLLGYWPSGQRRELHEVEVKLSKKGLKPTFRKRRAA